MVKPFGLREELWTTRGELTALFFTTYFLQQVLCRFIQSTDIDCIQLCLVVVWYLLWTKCVWYLVAIHNQMRLENSEIGLENWKFFIQKSGNPGWGSVV